MDIRKAFQDIIAPELRAIEGKFEAIDGKIGGLRTEIHRLDEKIDGVKDDVRNLREDFRMAIDLRERIAAIEAKVGLHH